MLAAAATFTLALVVVGRVFGRGEIARAVRAPWLRGFAPFSVPLGIAELMNAILQRADVVLLTAFVGPSATAVYAAAEFISRVIGNARYVFDGVAAPVFSEALHLGQRDRLRSNLLLMARWVATAAAPITVTVVALRHDLLALYGPAFQAGAVAITLLAVSHLVNATFGLAGYVLVVSGRSRLMLANNVVVAIVNVALGLILIPRFGLLGAAIAALAGVVLLHTLVTIEVRLAHGVYPVGWSMLKPLVAAAAMLGVETAVGANVARPAARIPLAIVAGLASYLAALVALGLAPEDKQLIARIRARFRGGERARGVASTRVLDRPPQPDPGRRDRSDRGALPGRRAGAGARRGHGSPGARGPPARVRRRGDRDSRFELQPAAPVPDHRLRWPAHPVPRRELRRRVFVQRAGARSRAGPAGSGDQARAAPRRSVRTRTPDARVALLDDAVGVPGSGAKGRGDAQRAAPVRRRRAESSAGSDARW